MYYFNSSPFRALTTKRDPMTARSSKIIALPLFILAATPAAASPWWYVDRGVNRVLFIDAGSIEREGNIVTYSSKNVIRDEADAAAMTSDFMRADCGKRQLGRLGIQRFSRDDKVIDTSTSRTAEMMEVPAESLGDAELQFVCSDGRDREKRGQFVLAVDDAAFTDALIGGAHKDLSPRALQERILANPNIQAVRSSASRPASFGSIQTVKKGDPIVPPRDYAKGPQTPLVADYSSMEVGRIYDIAYQGIEHGQIRFEVRGYSIDDVVHPGSGQIISFPRGATAANVRDIAIVIKAATANSLTYSVTIDKEAPPIVDACMPDHCDEEKATMEAADTPK
jgi:hypothetical protein